MTEQIDTSVEAVEREITVACIGDTPLAALLRALRSELTAAQSENTNLRAALAVSKDPCIYCQLPAEEMVKCRSGFPGCGRADDISGCPEFGAMMNEASLREELTAANARTDQARNAALEEAASMLRDLARKKSHEQTAYFDHHITQINQILSDANAIEVLNTTTPAVDDARDEWAKRLINYAVGLEIKCQQKIAVPQTAGQILAAFKAQDPQP